jgi:hypothetical protein
MIQMIVTYLVLSVFLARMRFGPLHLRDPERVGGIISLSGRHRPGISGRNHPVIGRAASSKSAALGAGTLPVSGMVLAIFPCQEFVGLQKYSPTPRDREDLVLV